MWQSDCDLSPGRKVKKNRVDLREVAAWARRPPPPPPRAPPAPPPAVHQLGLQLRGDSVFRLLGAICCVQWQPSRGPC